ncbi:MAG TPA: hypothetical protein VF410_12370, partial [Rhizomicrobium sp.]
KPQGKICLRCQAHTNTPQCGIQKISSVPITGILYTSYSRIGYIPTDAGEASRPWQALQHHPFV